MPLCALAGAAIRTNGTAYNRRRISGRHSLFEKVVGSDLPPPGTNPTGLSSMPSAVASGAIATLGPFDTPRSGIVAFDALRTARPRAVRAFLLAALAACTGPALRSAARTRDLDALGRDATLAIRRADDPHPLIDPQGIRPALDPGVAADADLVLADAQAVAPPRLAHQRFHDCALDAAEQPHGRIFDHGARAQARAVPLAADEDIALSLRAGVRQGNGQPADLPGARVALCHAPDRAVLVQRRHVEPRSHDLAAGIAITADLYRRAGSKLRELLLLRCARRLPGHAHGLSHHEHRLRVGVDPRDRALEHPENRDAASREPPGGGLRLDGNDLAHGELLRAGRPAIDRHRRARVVVDFEAVHAHAGEFGDHANDADRGRRVGDAGTADTAPGHGAGAANAAPHVCTCAPGGARGSERRQRQQRSECGAPQHPTHSDPPAGCWSGH